MRKQEQATTAAPQKGAAVSGKRSRFKRVPKVRERRVIDLGICCGAGLGSHARDSCAGCITCQHGGDPYMPDASRTNLEAFGLAGEQMGMTSDSRADHKKKVEAKYLAKGMRIVEWRDGNCHNIKIVVEDL